MTIHHDKMAYGRLASLREDFSEERLAEMAKKLSESAEDRAGVEREKAENAERQGDAALSRGGQTEEIAQGKK